ncbi:MAG TPA: trigger factor [Thermoanaerobaculia bacterium]|nr:trigger factor [Thermoanaerobaculia bacterium]
MSVVLSIEDVGPSKKELKIEVPAPAVEAETERVVEDYGRKVRLPGFRPGKVPAAVVRQRFREEIEREVIERLVPRYWRQAEAETGIDPLTRPELAGVEERSAGEALVFTARAEVRPEIELRDLSDVELPDPPSAPSEEEVAAALEELRRQAGDWVPVARPAGQGDLAVVEVEETTAPEGSGSDPKPPPAATTVEVEVGSPRVWEELSVALTGLSEGQKGEFSRMDEEEGRVRERSFRFEIRAVKERELPELDDELAQEIGGFETLAALTEAVRGRLAHDRAHERREARERVLLDALRERHPVVLPEGLVGAEIEGLVHEYAESLGRQGVDVEHAGIDWRAVAEQARPAAEKRVHARLVLDAVARREGIEVAAEELEAALARIAAEQKISTGQVRRALDADGRLGRLRAQMLRGKTLRHLLGEEPGGKSGELAAVEGGEAGSAGDSGAAEDEPPA